MAHALREGYNELDPIAVGVLIAICLIAVLKHQRLVPSQLRRLRHPRSRHRLHHNRWTHQSRYKKLRPLHPLWCPRNFQGLSRFVLRLRWVRRCLHHGGVDKTSAKDIPIGLVGSMVLTTVIYCLLAVTLCLMQTYKEIDPDAPFSRAFEQVGWSWAQYVVAAGALKGMTSVLLVSAVGQARYLTQIARTHMMPPWFAKVDPRTGTPINATVVMLAATAVIAFFTKLDILADLSISTLFIFMLVAVALLVRRYYVSSETLPENRNKLVTFLALILGSSIATAAYWGVSEKGWIGYCVTVSIWVGSTVGLWAWVPQAREPRMWGVPLVPLPSASIAINIFLLGSIDKDSFVRFGIWSVLLLVYYFLFGLHASYDTAKALESKVAMYRNAEEGKGVAVAAHSHSNPSAPPVF